MTFLETHVKWSLTLTDRLGPEILTVLEIKGEVLHRVRLHVKVSGWVLNLNAQLLSLATKLTPTQLLKGDLLEALPKNEQPDDPKRVVLGGIDRKLRVECHMDDVMKLTVQEADLLLPILSTTLRYQICLNRKLLDFGKRLAHGSLVLVSIKGYSKKLPGVVWFKGELLNSPGTMFGIELHVSLVI